MRNELTNGANNENETSGVGSIQHTEEEKLKAAYALNMCTVSISQIVDYNDLYILEQEYDAILNNLNLKQIPKDEALLKILTELLNTITYFRIHEIKKQQIEKKYEQRVRNAIWSAVPSLSVIMSGDPVAIAFSIATQVGIGYMNYRKEKVNAINEREDEEIELRITAIEQFNALKRELFTTAWRLADEYDFEDEWRITEKQIRQYNDILTDSDELRKYARLESIADRFVAYPPFWYFYGHTANYIAEMANDRLLKNHKGNKKEELEYYKDHAMAKWYRNMAKSHFEHFYKLSEYNILREDSMTASFALEYLDLLWIDGDRDQTRLLDLVRLAEKMAPTSFDILQLCVIAYMRIGETNEAVRIMKILVNEQYNLSVNAKLLSRIYVSQFIYGDKKEAERAVAEYQVLQNTAESVYLFPMPALKPLDNIAVDEELKAIYIDDQKRILQKSYRFVINEFIKQNIVKYNKLWPIPYTAGVIDEQYFGYGSESRKRRETDVEKALVGRNRNEYIFTLRDSLFRIQFIDLLNDVIRSLDELEVFRNYEDKDSLIRKIQERIVHNKDKLKAFQDKLDKGIFDYKDYLEMEKIFSFKTFTEEFFDDLKIALSSQIENIEEIASGLDESPMKLTEAAELDLIEFCERHSLPDPEDPRRISEEENSAVGSYYFDYTILGDDVDKEADKKEIKEKMRELIWRESSDLLSKNTSEALILLPDSVEFKNYFENSKLNRKDIKPKVIAIIDDRTKKDIDFVFTYEGYAVIKKNTVQPIKNYRKIRLEKQGTVDALDLGSSIKYSNRGVNIIFMYDLIQKLCEILESA